MRNALLCLIAATLLFPPAPSSVSAETEGEGEGATVCGHVFGADGKPLPAAHVYLTNWSGDLRWTVESARVGDDGWFSLPVEQTGVHRVVVTGVGHETASAPAVINEDRSTVEFTIRLARTVYAPSERVPGVVGNWVGWDQSKASPMVPTADGRFLLETEVDADTILYRIVDPGASGGTVDGTDADFYLTDNRGNYVAGLAVHPGPLRIWFDPARYAAEPDPDLPAVTYGSHNGDLAEIEKLDLHFAAAQSEFVSAFNQYRATHDSPEGFGYDWSPIVRDLEKGIHDTKYASVREFAAVKLMKLIAYSAELETFTPEEIASMAPPESPMWGWEPALITNVTRASDLFPGGREAFLEALAAKSPQFEIRGYATAELALLAMHQGNQKLKETRMAELRTTYAQVPGVERYLTAMTPALIAPGNKIPAFEVTLLDEPGKVTDKTIRGHYTLIDFWATWCAPCRAEMEGLHKAYQRFGGKNLDFLSISFDRNVDEVRKYREKGKWKLPWKNAFLEGGFRSPMAQAFEVKSIPKPVLVGPDGVIVATGNDLRGPALEKTLASVLGEGKSGKL